MDGLSNIIAGLPGLITALALHEYAHAWMAVRMGDSTPKDMGRLTLNPLAHVDFLGLAMLFIAHFGWAKPVIINPDNFKDRKKGEILVAGAGPVMNFFIAFLALAVYILLTHTLGIVLTGGSKAVLIMIILYNINFGLFNLIPIPPLDGSRILREFLPNTSREYFDKVARYGFLILLVVLMTPALKYVLVPASKLVVYVFSEILLAVF